VAIGARVVWLDGGGVLLAPRWQSGDAAVGTLIQGEPTRSAGVRVGIRVNDYCRAGSVFFAAWRARVPIQPGVRE